MYIVFDFINGDYDFVHTEKQAKDKAGEALKYYRDEAADEWPDDIENSVGYAKIMMQSKVTKIEKKEDYGEDWPYDYDEIWHVDLVEV